MTLLAIVIKDLRLLVRDRTALFFALMFPVLMAVFFGAIFSGGSDSAIDAVVVDEDRTADSAEVIAALSESGALAIERVETREAALEAVRTGETTAYLAIPAGFARARAAMFASGGGVVIGVDPSRRAEAAMLSGIVARTLYAGFGDAFGGGGPPRVVELEPVTRVGKQPPSYFAISFPQGIVWGLMMCAMSFGMALVSEREGGTLMRLRVAPISRAYILAGKAGACLALVLVVQTGLLLLGAAVFGVELGAVPQLAIAVLSSAVCFVGVMMMLATLGRTEKAASGYATGVMILLMMLGGGMVPLMFMPEWMQVAGTISPVKWAMLALEGATWRDFSTVEMLRPALILVGFGAATFTTGAMIFRD